MTVRFSVDRWAAWAPGLQDHAAWHAWLRAPESLADTGTPPLAEMPPLLRRRVERLGRVALQATYWARRDGAASAAVFASRHGDIHCSLQLLGQLAHGESMSPASFSTSVHNAIGALYSIANGHTGPYTAVAAGEETVEAAFIEALGQLADGTPDVLVVYYDLPLPSPYDVFDDSIRFARAAAYHLSLATSGGFSLQSGPSIHDGGDAGGNVRGDVSKDGGAGPQAPGLTPDLAILDFLVASDAPRHVRTVGSRRWEWTRHA